MNEKENKIIITLENDERTYDQELLGVNYNSTDKEIIESLSPILAEEIGVNLDEDFENGYWTIKHIDSTGNIYIFPKSTAG